MAIIKVKYKDNLSDEVSAEIEVESLAVNASPDSPPSATPVHDPNGGGLIGLDVNLPDQASDAAREAIANNPNVDTAVSFPIEVQNDSFEGSLEGTEVTELSPDFNITLGAGGRVEIGSAAQAQTGTGCLRVIDDGDFSSYSAVFSLAAADIGLTSITSYERRFSISLGSDGIVYSINGNTMRFLDLNLKTNYESHESTGLWRVQAPFPNLSLIPLNINRRSYIEVRETLLPNGLFTIKVDSNTIFSSNIGSKQLSSLDYQVRGVDTLAGPGKKIDSILLDNMMLTILDGEL